MIPKQEFSPDTVARFEREVARLVRRLFEEAGLQRGGAGLTEEPRSAVDVFETEEELGFEIETPGCRRKDLTLTVSRDLIVLEGEKNQDRGKVKYHCMERTFGHFRRLIEIPTPVDTAELTAVYRAGVVIIRAPKIAERRGAGRQVEIQEES